MLRMKTTATRMSSPAKFSSTGGGGGPEAVGSWELRPGGMLVQKRNSGYNQNSIPIPTIKVRVIYGSSNQEIKITSQASFGELKKMLAGPTGLHPQDQKLMYKDKERESKAYLDVAGVKDGSKIVLIEDVLGRERRCLESRKNAKMDKALKEIADISLEVDKLHKQVANLEAVICGGKKVLETVLLNLIELFMTQLIKLDGIVADGDVKLRRRMQVKRVQKYIETLDMLRNRNSMLVSKAPLQHQEKISTRSIPTQMHMHKEQRKERNTTRLVPGPVVVTTNWETFDSSGHGGQGTIYFCNRSQASHS